MATYENFNQNEIDERFNQFWNSVMNDFTNSIQFKHLQKNIKSTNSKQLANYRRYLKDGVKLALESLETDSSTLFPDMESITQWNFTAFDFKSIKVMDDRDYFEDKRYGQWNLNSRPQASNLMYVHTVGKTKREIRSDSPIGYYDDYGKWRSSKGKCQWALGKWQIKGTTDISATQYATLMTESQLTLMTDISANKYATLMTELYSKFDKSIDDNPQTQRNFDGTVDEPVIRDLCLGFKKSIEELATKYDIRIRDVKPRFFIICVAFASYKMLLPRLAENLELMMTKDYYKKLYVFKLKGAQKN